MRYRILDRKNEQSNRKRKTLAVVWAFEWADDGVIHRYGEQRGTDKVITGRIDCSWQTFWYCVIVSDNDVETQRRWDSNISPGCEERIVRTVTSFFSIRKRFFASERSDGRMDMLGALHSPRFPNSFLGRSRTTTSKIAQYILHLS